MANEQLYSLLVNPGHAHTVKITIWCVCLSVLPQILPVIIPATRHQNSNTNLSGFPDLTTSLKNVFL